MPLQPAAPFRRLHALPFALNALRLLCLALVLAGLGAPSPLLAQAHAPSPPYHDAIQRVYPIELARLLAWRENLGAPRYAGVRWTLNSADERNTRWTIEFIGTDGRKVLRKVELHYPASLAGEGPRFYREILARLLAEQDWSPTPPSTRAELSRAFFEGLSQSSPTRMGSARGLIALMPAATADVLTDPARAPFLAGRLLSTTLAGVPHLSTLDGTLGARAAAWLALSERMLDGEEPSDKPWAPLLWTVHRERAAAALWAGADDPATEAATQAASLYPFWNYTLALPSPREALEQAATLGDLDLALALAANACRRRDDVRTFVSLATKLAAYQPDALKSRTDFAAWIWAERAGRQLPEEDGWPRAFRNDWLTTLATLPGEEMAAVPGLREKLDRAWVGRDQAAVPGEDPSLQGLAPMIELIGLGMDKAHKLLPPVGLIDARDLLHAGAETTALQLSARHHQLGADTAAAKAIREALVGPLPQMVTAFGIQDAKELEQATEPANEEAPTAPPRPLFRLPRAEIPGELPLSRIAESRLPGGMPNDKRNPYTRMAYRSWLLLDGRLRLHTRNSPDNELMPLLERLRAEGGPTGDAEGLRVLAAADRGMPSPLVNRRRSDMRAELGRSLPADDPAWASLLASERRGLDALDALLTRERFFWNEPSRSFRLENHFQGFVETGAFGDARLFHDAVAGLQDFELTASLELAPARVLLELATGNTEAAGRALEAVHPSSPRKLQAALHVAAARGDRDEATRLLATGNASKAAAGAPDHRLLQAFLPLWPALADEKSPQHEQALLHFDGKGDWLLLRWLLAKHHGLSPEKTRRFLGGDKAQGEALLFIHAATDDRYAFNTLFHQLRSKGPLSSWHLALLTQLRLTMERGTPRPLSGLERVARRDSIVVFADKLQKARAAEKARDRLEALTSADLLFAHIENLSNRTGAETLAASLDRLREQAAACERFLQAHPEDARRWRARLTRLVCRKLLLHENKADSEAAIEKDLEALSLDPGASPALRVDAGMRVLQARLARVPAKPSQAQLEAAAAHIETWRERHAADSPSTSAELLLGDLFISHDAARALGHYKEASRSLNPRTADLGARGRRRAELLSLPADQTLTTLEGRSLELSALRGGQVMLFFWSSADATSTRALAQLLKLRELQLFNHVTVITVSLDRSRGQLEAYLKANPLPWPVCLDKAVWAAPVSREWGVQRMPGFILINAAGKARLLPAEARLDEELAKDRATP